jgi:hypothetical protein
MLYLDFQNPISREFANDCAVLRVADYTALWISGLAKRGKSR